MGGDGEGVRVNANDRARIHAFFDVLVGACRPEDREARRMSYLQADDRQERLTRTGWPGITVWEQRR